MGVESEYFSLVLDGSLGVRAGINGWKSEVSATYIHATGSSIMLTALFVVTILIIKFFC
jgi:hypothetical protein